MKTLTILFFILFAISFALNAQITKGNWMVGGDASFFSNKTESNYNGNINTSETSYLRLSPNIGYFFMDKLNGGIGLNLNFVDPGKTLNSQGYGFNPYIRYYFLEAKNQINLFSQLGYNWGFGKNGLGIKTDTNGYNFKIGSALFFNSCVGLEFSLNYSHIKNVNDKIDTYVTNQFLVGLGFQIHLEK